MPLVPEMRPSGARVVLRPIHEFKAVFMMQARRAEAWATITKVVRGGTEKGGLVGF